MSFDRRWPALSLLVLAIFTMCLGLGRQAITDSDEAFYAEASREMVESGDWLTPHFNYEERWEKPILYYWVTAAAFVVGGVTESMARLGAALSGICLVILTWAVARRLTRDENAGWIAGAIAATCYGYFAMSRLALPDLPLAFFITATIWAAMRGSETSETFPARWWAIAGLASGLGFLTKGPLALVIPAIVLLPIWWRERRTVVLRPRHIVLAAAIFAVIGLPWYVAMTMRHGSAYLASFFVSDNLERFATTRYNDARAVWYYLPIVLGGLLPWAGFLLVFSWRIARDIVRRKRPLSGTEWKLAIWALAPLILFTISVGKQPRYILPVLPPLAVMLGMGIADRIRARNQTAARRELKIATLATAAMFATLAVLFFRARPLFISAFPALTTVSVIAVACAALTLAALAMYGAWSRLPAVMAICASILLLSAQFGAFAGRRPEAVEQVAAIIQANRHGNESIGQYETFVRNLPFYTHLPQVPVTDDTAAVEFLKRPERVLLVLHRDDLERLKTLTDEKPTTLGEVTYLNTASVRARTLLAPLPEQDLETVVVVSNK